MNPTHRRVRPFLGGAALVASLLIGACSDDDASPGTSAPTTDVSPAPGAPGATTAAEMTTTTLDPAGSLQQGLVAMSSGYHFVSTVTVNGAPSLVAEGDRIGNASRLTLTSAEATVAYVITPEGNYVKPEDGDWERLDVAPATADPVGALAAPNAVAVLPTTDGSLQVRVTVAAVALGIAAEGTVDVDVTVQGGAVTRIAYSAPVEGGTATVITDISAVVDPTPIAPPI